MYNIVGTMSGTSLDGLDLCLVNFTLKESKWSYTVLKYQTYKYPARIIQLFELMKKAVISQYLLLNIQYTQFVIDKISAFLKGVQSQVDLISTHGHTLFHQPNKKIILQCGDPVLIAATMGINTVGNFRQLDVYRGGQGAPLVPYGSELFQGYDAYLNLGGIANIDCQGIGWDIGFCNMVFNHYAKQYNLEYDHQGTIGRSGVQIDSLYSKLKHYKKMTVMSTQKSFGEEDFRIWLKNIPTDLQAKDIMQTYYQYLSVIILKNVTFLIEELKLIKHKQTPFRILCTGGGAYNDYLLQLLQLNNFCYEFIKADPVIIQMKEAIIFAYLGLKYLLDIKNCKNGIGGVLAKGAK